MTRQPEQRPATTPVVRRVAVMVIMGGWMLFGDLATAFASPNRGSSPDPRVVQEGMSQDGKWGSGGTTQGPQGEPLGQILLLFQWGLWIAVLICLAAFLGAAGRIGVALHHGEPIQGMKAAVLTLVAAVVAGASLGIAATLIA